MDHLAASGQAGVYRVVRLEVGIADLTFNVTISNATAQVIVKLLKAT